jgi:hypothetical protein
MHVNYELYVRHHASASFTNITAYDGSTQFALDATRDSLT